METVSLTQQEVDYLREHNASVPSQETGTRWKCKNGEDAWLLREFIGKEGEKIFSATRKIEIVSVDERLKRANSNVEELAKEIAKAVESPEIRALTESAPALMGELMKKFIDGKDLNARAQVRLRMKALLDLFSVDTNYPPIPALNPDQRDDPGVFARAAAPAFGQGEVGVGMAPYIQGVPPPPRPQPDQYRRAIEDQIRRELEGAGARPVEPVPGAEAAQQAPDNEAIL